MTTFLGPFLSGLVLILVVSTLCVFVLNRFKQSTVLGYLLAGLLLGPSGFDLVKDPTAIRFSAELGIIFLMFSIGLEMNWQRLKPPRPNRRSRGRNTGDLDHRSGFRSSPIFLDLADRSLLWLCSGPLSSTALALEILTERGTLHSPVGRSSLAILIAQDLAIVALLLLVPLLAAQTAPGTKLLLPLLEAAGVLFVVVVAGFWGIPRFLRGVAALKNPELLTLSTAAICLGTAWLTWKLGLSLALGAFLAGLLIASSEYRHQVEADFHTLRVVFLGIFFVSLGMLLRLDILAKFLGQTVGLLLLLLLIKGLVIGAVLSLLRFPIGVAAAVGLVLAQIGELSFVLLETGRQAGVVEPHIYQILLAGGCLSLAATPFLISLAEPLRERLTARFGGRDFGKETEEEQTLKEHFILAGFGPAGRMVADFFEETDVSYTVVEMNSRVVGEERKRGRSIFYGDVSSRRFLEKLGVEKARGLILTIPDPHAVRRTVRMTRQLNPKIYILVRVPFADHAAELKRLGANEVVVGESEVGFKLGALALSFCNIPPSKAHELLQTPPPKSKQ